MAKQGERQKENVATTNLFFLWITTYPCKAMHVTQATLKKNFSCTIINCKSPEEYPLKQECSTCPP